MCAKLYAYKDNRTPPARAVKEDFINRSLASFAAKVAEVVLALLVVILLGRMLGVDGYGTYAFVLALVSLISLPARLGLPPLIVRETAKGEATGQWAQVHGIWRWSIGVTLILSGIVVTGGLLFIFSQTSEPGQLSATFLFGLLLVPLLSLAALRAGMLRGLRKITAGNLVGLISQPALLVLMLLVGLFISDGVQTPSAAMLLTVLSALAAFLLGSWIISLKEPAEITQTRPEYLTRYWLGAALPMAMTQGAYQINRYTDVLLLGILSTLFDAGIYRIATQGAMLVSLGMMALGLVTAPDFARVHSQNSQSELQHLVRRSAQSGFAFALVVSTGFAVVGQALITLLFGEQFAGVWLPLMILSGGHLISTAIGPSGMLLNMTGHERAVTRAVTIAAGTNVLLNLLLIPPFGVTGAATATAFSLVLWQAWLWNVARSELGIRCSAF